MRATDAFRLPSTSAPSTGTIRPSRCSCRWGCPCPCRPRTSTSPTRSRRSSIRPAFRSRPALPSPHREGRPGAGPAEPPRQSRRWYPRRGTRPFTFKTTFGEVTVQRSRISHKHDGTIEVPSAKAWETSHQLHITRNLRDAVCDQFSDRSAGESRAEVCRNAGDEDLLGRSTVIDIVHQEGEQLIRASGARPRGPGRSVRGPVGLARPRCCRPRRPAGLVDDDLPLDDSEEAQLEWEQVQAEWVATGFPGCGRRSRWPRTNPARWMRGS